MNKIVLVSNLKGGTGKTSICELLAIYAVEKGLPTMVLDADKQLDVYEDRKDDLLKHPEADPLFDISPLTVDANLPSVIAKLKELNGVIFIDCPGSLDNNYLAALYQAADVVVVPFRYERKNVRDTGKFTHIFRQLNANAKWCLCRTWFVLHLIIEKQLRRHATGRMRSLESMAISLLE